MSTQRAVKHVPRSSKSTSKASTKTASSDDALDVRVEPTSPSPEVVSFEAAAAKAHGSFETMAPNQAALENDDEILAEDAANDVAVVPPGEVTLISKPSKTNSEEERNMRLFREDPLLDRRIIEGMLNDRETFMETMAKEGFTANAVLRRAAELGLSEALVRQVKGVAADLAGERPGRRSAPASLGARTCLSCDRIFLSSGPGNRLCMRCRGGDAGLAQL